MSEAEAGLHKELEKAVSAMRKHQRAWFAEHRTVDLEQSKAIEGQVDQILQRLQESRHPTLF